ncbi:MAG: sigma-E factor negative regulatory protein RseA [Gammaproteobacteria bacterium]|jgi:sigma-E factor negative regulatory protein RseA
MNDELIEESLSALMDGELPSARAERVLDRVLDDARLREQWRRYHLISAALSSQDALSVVDDELAARVRQALGSEVIPLRTPSRRKPWMIGIACAASVAAVALLVVLNVTGQQATEPGAGVPQVATIEPNTTTTATTGNSHQPVAPQLASLRNDSDAAVDAQPTASSLTRMTWNDAGPAVEARLNGYLLDHNGYLADGVRGMLPYARVVAYDTRD